jgi:predicted deacylase
MHCLELYDHEKDTIGRVKYGLRRFDDLIQSVGNYYDVETLAPRVHVLHPKSVKTSAEGPKDVPLTVTALIHGVEVAGLAVLVELLELVTRGAVKLHQPLGLALGNIAAAEKGVRFVERDLNRSFGRDALNVAEERRADELEILLNRSDRLLDLHQVKLTIDRPFWIFPYTKAGYQFARAVASDVTLITHWGKSFSQDGKCSDEWVNLIGGTGVTLELGQNGFDRAQVDQGLKAVCRAIDVAAIFAKDTPIEAANGKLAPIYTWGEIVPYPQTGRPVLDAGWHNFKMVKAGDRLGEFEGRVICAKSSGPVLFPKYPDPLPDGTYAATPPAAELIRIMREITESELPA